MPATAYLGPQSVSLHSILANTNPANPSPSIDLEWEPFQAHVEAFLGAIDTYSLAAKTEIAARATDHTGALRDLEAEKKETERRIQVERQREGDMLATLETERHTLTDLTSSLSRVQASLAKVRDQNAALETELAGVRKEVLAERATKQRQAQVLNDMRGRDGEDLAKLENVLGWRVEGVKPNVLLMTFTLLDPSDPDREFQFLIDVSRQEYSVPNCSPALPDLPELVHELNVDRDLFAFIRRVRKAFKALVSPAPPPATRFDDLAGPASRTPAPSRVLEA